MTTRRTLANDLRTVRELKAGCDTAAPRIGRHRAEIDRPGPGSQPPAWNNSTTIIQTIRDALADARVTTTADVLPPVVGPAPVLEGRPLDLGVGLWR